MEVQKAYAITDAKISYVSLVDKAANKRRFLITKAEDGEATFSTMGRIVKKDADNHFVTGIVYEPMTADAHDNYMTEEEITKAAYFFMKNGGKVDLQHSFEPLEGAAIVESWVEKSDTEIEGEKIQKGTWLMTMEITDTDTWSAIEKGEITGFSMGGVGLYSDDDVNLDEVEKTEEPQTKKGLFKKLAEMMGFDVVEKGTLKDRYNEEMRGAGFWNALNTLENTLSCLDPYSSRRMFETDETKIREALSEFSEIITQVLATDQPIAKTIGECPQEIAKAGRTISSANRERLQGVYDAIGALLEASEPPKKDDSEGESGEGEETPDDAASEAKTEGADKEAEEQEKKKEEQDVTKAEVEQIVNEAIPEAVAKALDSQKDKAEEQAEKQPEAVTKEEIQGMINEAVAKAVEPILKARGIPTAMNSGTDEAQKPQEQHYLHGFI